MSRSILLPLLASGDFRSGQELAEQLGVSRTAVWKQVNRLVEESGLPIESVKGKGYRIAGGVDLLEGPLVTSAMSEQSRNLHAPSGCTARSLP